MVQTEKFTTVDICIFCIDVTSMATEISMKLITLCTHSTALFCFIDSYCD